MEKSISIIGVILFCCLLGTTELLQSQEQSNAKLTIKGQVLYNNTPVQDIILQLTDSGKTINLITNKFGRFELKNYEPKSDSLLFQISKEGFMDYNRTITDRESLTALILSLTKDSVYKGTAVIIKARNVSIAANKKTYKINSKNFIANAKSTAVIKTLPDLTIVNGNIKLENRKTVLVFIDGIESSKEEMDRLDAQDIDKIEVISNPSAIYSSDQSNAVLQIITKKKTQNFIKGEVETYAGVRLGSFGVTPTISLKMKKIMFNTFWGYGTNNQNIASDLTREDAGQITKQNTYKEITGWQAYSSSKLKITFNPRSFLYFGGTLFGYQFKGNLEGKSNINTITNNFKVTDIEKLNKWNISSIYNYVINKKSDFFIKARYFDYKNNNESIFCNYNDPESVTAIFSDTKEYSGEVIYNRKNEKLFKQPFDYSVGLKNIYRKFFFQSSGFNLNQYINSFYANGNIQFSTKFSMYGSLLGETTSNTGSNVKQNYFYFLPTASFLYKLNNKVNLGIDYSRRITRPSGNYLNPNAIFFDPTYSLKGNINLLPQVRNNFEFSIQKQFNDKTSMSFKLFYENITNSIIESFTKNNNTIITTYENAGKSAVKGGYASFNSLLFKNLSINYSTGLNYNSFASDLPNAVIKENSGFSYNSNLYLSLLIKKIFNVSLNGNFNTPYYTLISKITNQPEFGLDIETAAFKKKLNIRLSYNDMFAWNTRSKNSIQDLNFLQISRNNNKRTNLNLTLIYKFGKNFNDRFSNPGIRNDDIINK